MCIPHGLMFATVQLYNEHPIIMYIKQLMHLVIDLYQCYPDIQHKNLMKTQATNLQ